jgi:hypothetical protein
MLWKRERRACNLICALLVEPRLCQSSGRVPLNRLSGGSSMRRLILGAAALTALPLIASNLICLPVLPEPVQLFGVSGGLILLEAVRLF